MSVYAPTIVSVGLATSVGLTAVFAGTSGSDQKRTRPSGPVVASWFCGVKAIASVGPTNDWPSNLPSATFHSDSRPSL